MLHLPHTIPSLDLNPTQTITLDLSLTLSQFKPNLYPDPLTITQTAKDITLTLTL